MPAITFTYASLGAYTGGFSSVRVPKTTGKLTKRLSELLKTTGSVVPRYSTSTIKSIITNTNIVWSNLFNRKIAITGITPAMFGSIQKQISQTTSYTGATTPKYGTFKRVSIYGTYSVLSIKKTTGFNTLPMVGSNRTPFSAISKATGIKTVYIGSANAKIKLWYSTIVSVSGDTTQANIQFWS